MRAWGGPPQSAATGDTVPADALDNPRATTVLSHTGTRDGQPFVRVMVAREVWLTADRTRLARISPDGWLVFRENAGRATRRVRITAGPGTRLRYAWSGDFGGVDREAWLQRMVTHFADATRPSGRW